jgi:(1->4)-alpha-D-glucan 1-alpha-D-glucosylmutase
VALLNRVVASVETSEAALSLIVRILTGDLPEDCRERRAVQNPLPAAYRAADGEVR